MFILVFCAIFIIKVYPQAGWFTQNSGDTNTLRSIFFVNPNTGWAVGYYGTVLKTTNSGMNWNSQTISYPPSALLEVYFINNNTGWIVGGYIEYLYTDRVILKTTDGGQNWSSLLFDNGAPLHSVFFINSLVGWVGGGISGILKTTNGGTNFFVQPINTDKITTIYFADINTGYAGSQPHVFKTTNSGNNWQEVGNFSVSKIHFFNSMTGITVGYGRVMKTTNGGLNWVELIHDYAFRTGVSFSDFSYGTIVELNRNVRRTTNGGNNWSYQYITTYEPWDVMFLNQNTGWICGASGLILKTTTGGEPTNIRPISSKTPGIFSLFQNYPNPFNPKTKIKIQIAKQGEANLIVYDALGRKVETLINKQLQPGTYEVEWDGSNYTSGVYFYRIEAVGFVDVKKMILLK